MANSYTTRLKKRLPAVSDSNWDDEWHDNEKIDEVVAGALLSVNRVISGGAVTDGGGLTSSFAAAVIRLDGEQVSVDATSLLMTASQVNWIYIDASGDVVKSLTPPSGTYIPLALVDTSDVAILRIADLRPMAEAASAIPAASDIGMTPTVMPDLSLAYQPANRENHIVDGDFNFWFEAGSQTSSGYGSDTMWLNENIGSTKVHSRQTFTLGQTLVPGNPKYFSRTVVTSVAGASNFCRKSQRIESVLSNAGLKKTISFYADVDANKNIGVEFVQNFGTGGSPSAEVTAIGAQLIAVTPGFKKYTVTVDLPSVTGKTLGSNNNDYLAMVFWFDAGSTFAARAASLGQQSGTFDLARVRGVAGEVDGDAIDLDYGEELTRCQRYYNQGGSTMFSGNASAGLNYYCHTKFPTTMRAIPVVTAINESQYGFPVDLVITGQSIEGFKELRNCNAPAANAYFTSNSVVSG